VLSLDASQLGGVDVRPDSRDPSSHLKHAREIPSYVETLESRDEV
jgi:hypothetical protein